MTIGFSIERMVFLIFFADKKINNKNDTVENSEKMLKNSFECPIYIKKLAFGVEKFFYRTNYRSVGCNFVGWFTRFRDHHDLCYSPLAR